MRDHVNPCRIYSLNDEAGTIICAYPPSVRKPVIIAPYSEETMHGFEYAVGSHMIKRGLEKEGLACVKAVRDKYDGMRRNPWSEMECGSTYARSLASYALLLVYSGFEFDMYRKHIGFHPVHDGDGSYFWSLDSGFGEYKVFGGTKQLRVAYGTLAVKTVKYSNSQRGKLFLNGNPVEFTWDGDNVSLQGMLVLKKGDTLELIEG